MTLSERIRAQGPKRILALDGGGIRGIITLEILAVLETLLREQSGRQNDFVLADYFDFIAGTSTGAIIGTALSLGMSVTDIRSFYLETGREMFEEASVLRRFRYKYEDTKLSQKLHEMFGADTTLGSDRLKTLLMMVMRNATTDSPWPVTNNPFAKFNQRELPGCNLNIPLWQLVRASTAAPCFFPPEVVRVGAEEFIFIDGALTTYNNPAFQAFLMATVEPYNLNWPAGEDKILLVSIGTGTNPKADANLQPFDMNILYNSASLPLALMFAALNEQDFLCRVFGQCLAGDPLDQEIGDLIGKQGPVQPKLFTYLRYNAELTLTGLDELGLPHIRPEEVQKIDSVKHIDDLQQIGRTVAQKKVKFQDFAAFL
ncbi:MAG: patatin-like phospholipase family protein [Desulfobaccales bacterium]